MLHDATRMVSSGSDLMGGNPERKGAICWSMVLTQAITHQPVLDAILYSESLKAMRIGPQCFSELFVLPAGLAPRRASWLGPQKNIYKVI